MIGAPLSSSWTRCRARLHRSLIHHEPNVVSNPQPPSARVRSRLLGCDKGSASTLVLPIGPDEFRLAIPHGLVAPPLALYRHAKNILLATLPVSEYHRTVPFVLPRCLSSGGHPSVQLNRSANVGGRIQNERMRF